MCCRDGNYKQNKCKRLTDEKRPTQKPSNQHCLSRMYVDEYRDGHVEVMYLMAHSGHELGSNQIPYLPLPISTKENVALKISQGIPPGRIIDGKLFTICSLFHYYITLEKTSERELVIETNDLSFCSVFQESTSLRSRMFETSMLK